MSLINLLNEQKQEQEVSNVKSTGRTILSTAAVAGTAYMLSENINLKSGVKKTYGTLKNSSSAQNELGKAGIAIRKDADALKTIMASSRKESIKKFKETVLSDTRLNELFDEASSPEEARAFLSALFDTADSQMTDDATGLDATVRKLYEEVGSGKTIEQKDKDAVIDFYKNNIAPSGAKLEEFKKRHGLMMRTKGQFNTTLDKFTTKGTKTVGFKAASMSDLDSKALGKFQQLQRWAPGKNIQIVSIDEFADPTNRGLGTSQYARIEHGGRYHNVALKLAKDQHTGMAIIRGTEGLSTRYTVSSGVIDATKLFPDLNINNLSTPGGHTKVGFNQAFDKATVNMEDHLFNMIRENRNSFLNFNTRNINQYNDYIRSMSLETPRTMVGGLNRSRTVNGEIVKLIDDDLMEALNESTRIQASTQRIVGLERFAAKDRENVTKRLLEYNNELYSGTSGSQTLTSRFQDPFDLDRELVVGHITRRVDASGKMMPTPMNMMKRYGHMDASMNPQSARSVQNIGRPEVARGFVGADADAVFGRGRKDSTGNLIGQLKISGAGSELIGISSDPIAEKARGVNLGAIMVFEHAKQAVHGKNVIQNPASMLGLGEGMSYIGGTVQIKKGYTKTVNYEGVNQSKLLTEVLAAAENSDRGFLTIGSKDAGDDYDIDDFFKKFSDDEGRAVLGKQDDNIIHIKRHQGMRRFTLGLSEKSNETGRDRYHLKGKIYQDARHNKLFSTFAKDSTLTVSKGSMMQKLNQLGLEDVGDVFFNEKGFGGKIANTLLTSTAQVGKSAQYLRTQIHGGMRMLGTDEDALNKVLDDTMRQLNDGDKLLAEVNSSLLKKEPHLTQLDQVTAKQRSASTLGKFFESISERAAKEGIKKEHFSMVMSFAQYQAEEGKFGLNIKYFQKKVREGLRKGDSNLGDKQIDDYVNAIDKMSKRAVVIGATHASVGTPHTDLGRNIAKVEPRFANFLYSSLRSFWEMDAKEATGYVSSMINRMEGFESRASGFLGMKITQDSLGKLGTKEIQAQISGLEDVGKLTKEEADELLSFGQGREREVVEKLSERKSGNILNLEEMGFSKKAMEALTEFTGGKKEIFLPGEDTFKGFIGHEIRSADEIIKVEAEYGRSVTDLLSSLSSLKDAESDTDQISSAIKGFKKVRSTMSKTSATAIRHALSGRVLGSGSYMGGGFSTGKGAGHIGATVFNDDAMIQAKMAAGLSDVMNKEMGYVAFMDQQAFLDGMTKYEAAVEKHLMATRKSTSVKAEVRKVMQETLEAFFTGMHRPDKEGVSAAIQRNPVIGFSHIWAGMGIYQYDFTEDLKPLAMLRSVDQGTEWTGQYKDHLKEMRRALNQPELDALLKKATIEDVKDEKGRTQLFEKAEKLKEAQEKKYQEYVKQKELPSVQKAQAEKNTLINEKNKIKSDPAYASPEERRLKLFKGEYNSSRDARGRLGVLGDEIGEAHKHRLHYETVLKEEEKSLQLAIEEADRKNMGNAAEDSKTPTSAQNKLKRQKKKLKKVQKKLEGVRSQISYDVSNEKWYGRPVLGGEDVSNKNVERAISTIFSESLEDVGYALRTGRSFEDVQLRHFQGNAQQGKEFLNQMGSFFGFEKQGGSIFTDELLDSNNTVTFKPQGSDDSITQHALETKKYKTMPGMAYNEGSGSQQFGNYMHEAMYARDPYSTFEGGKRQFVIPTDVNRANKESLMELYGVGSKKADAIIRERSQSNFKSLEDFKARVPGVGDQILTKNELAVAPIRSKVDVFETLVGDRSKEDAMWVEGIKREEYYANKARMKEINQELNTLDNSEAGKHLKKKNDLFEEMKAIETEQAKIKEGTDLIKEAQDELYQGDKSLSLADVDKKIIEDQNVFKTLGVGGGGVDPNFTGKKIQPKDPGVHRDLATLDAALGGEVKTGGHLAQLREMKETGSLNDEQVKAYDNIYRRMVGMHKEFGEHGGGTIRFPQIEMSMKLVNEATGATSNFSGRMDFVRFGIGDFDADTFQVFFDTDKALRNKIKAKEVDPTKLYTYGAQFLTNMHLLGEGVGKLGERMGASKMTVAQSLVDEYQKEQIVKGIGGLDVQVKAGMLGLAQAAADDTSGDFANQFKRMQAGASLISVAQEVLGIKGKKLPIAANISREYMGALKTSYETGSGDALKAFFKEKVLKGTLLETGSGNIKVEKGSVKFHNLDKGDAATKFTQALTDMNMSVDEMFETFDIMAKNVKKHGLNRFTSNAALGKMLEGSSKMNSQQLFGLLNRGYSMEGGTITGNMKELEDIFGKIDAVKETFASSVSRTKGLAGIVAGGLLGSYAIGANSDIGSLEPGGKFSDSRSKEALKAGQSLSNRALQQSFSREHGNINPGRISPMENFYERPINSGVATVSLNRSVKMYGEAPSLSAAQSMGKHFVSSGGQASLTINDNRRPIGPAYMNKLMRD
tara:strand:- start:1494 stop:8756 length:7263 start_codon:yes stop_codon:yes gene_type:complete